MHVRGAIHMHSSISHDGTLPVAGLAAWYRRKNYQFIAVTEHAEDLDDGKMQMLREQCDAHSDDRFRIIPGAEFSFREFHILGIGAVAAAAGMDARAAIKTIHRSGGMAVLAHPKRFGWAFPAEILQAVDAIEIWNVGYDGKYLPSVQAGAGYAAMKRIHPPLLAMAGHDLHRVESFYDVGLEMEVGTLSAGEILGNLRRGRYAIESRFFSAGPDGQISKPGAAFLRVLSGNLSALRRARTILLELLP